MNLTRAAIAAAFAGLGLLSSCQELAAQAAENIPAAIPSQAVAAVLPAEKWAQLENGVDRALAWMASQQSDDGSFPTCASGQPGVTSLCVLAFLSRGHQPGLGPYGNKLNHAIDYVLASQKPNGLFSLEEPEEEWIRKHASHTAAYNHAIAGLMLGEVYGHVSGQRARAVKKAIQSALQFTRDLQTRPKDNPFDSGGWRYLRTKQGEPDSDLSVTAWQLMFYRSAKNAEFAVPQQYVEDGLKYVKACWDDREGCFAYARLANDEFWPNNGRALNGAGILSLSLGGQHQTQIAKAAGEWLLARPYHRPGEALGGNDRYFYSCYYCSQAAMQLGGRYWEGIFPPLAETLLACQKHDGSWPMEITSGDAIFGNAYTTAMAVLALTPPYQLLPVYQK